MKFIQNQSQALGLSKQVHKISLCTIIICFCACSTDKKNDSVYNDSIHVDNSSIQFDTIRKQDSVNLELRRNIVKKYMDDENLFDTSDPDTAIVVYLYLNHNSNIDLVEDFEIYFRWDLEYNVLSKKYFDILGKDRESELAFEAINRNRQNFINIMRRYVDSFYQETHSLDSKEFQFLFERKDQTVEKLLKKATKDPLANEDSRQYAIEKQEECAGEGL